jgi:hypothetical protein
MADKLSSEGLKAAADTTKQVITLATGVIALTVTFLEKIIQPTASAGRHVPWTMFAAWIFFGLAILFGVLTLGAITGTLDALDRKQNGQTVSAAQQAAIDSMSGGRNVIVPALCMNAGFMVGMALTILTGFLLLAG